MILTVSAFGTYRITVLTILYGLLNAKPDISTNSQRSKNCILKIKWLKFSLLFHVLIHPLYQVLGTQRFLAGMAFEFSSLLRNIVKDLTHMYATKLVRAWGRLRATTIGATWRVGTLWHFGSSDRKDAEDNVIMNQWYCVAVLLVQFAIENPICTFQWQSFFQMAQIWECWACHDYDLDKNTTAWEPSPKYCCGFNVEFVIQVSRWQRFRDQFWQALQIWPGMHVKRSGICGMSFS